MNKMKSGIYMWTSPSGKSYIGQATDLVRRYNAFLQFNCSYGGTKINNARKKYHNLDEWTYIVLEHCDIDELDERERYYIALYDTMNNGYNCESGGNKNKELGEETRKKISVTKKNNYVKEKHPNYGKHLDQNIREKISKTLSKDHRFIGIKRNEETRKKISAARKGKHQSEETKKKIQDKKKKISILQFDLKGNFICEYVSLREAERKTGVKHGNIKKVCDLEYKQCNGFIWRYKKESD